MENNSQQTERADPKIGQGHASAWMRAGLKEVATLFAALPDSIQTVEEYGLAGTKLPSEVADDRKGPNLEPEQKSEPNHNIEMEM